MLISSEVQIFSLLSQLCSSGHVGLGGSLCMAEELLKPLDSR